MDRLNRSDEILNVDVVTIWLHQQDIWVKGEPKVSQQFSGGSSNWTYRLEYDNYDLILRRPPYGSKTKAAHDMVREYHIQLSLAPFYPLIPKVIALCQDQSILGCDFYVMQYIEGIILRKSLPRDWVLEKKDLRMLCTNMLDQLIHLHQIPYDKIHFLPLESGNYCQRQFEEWNKRFIQAQTRHVPSFKYVRQWLKKNIPEQSQTCIIHHNWRFDNLILNPENPTHILGVLDWEMVSLGDPLMDLGCALAYWVEARDPAVFRVTRRQPTHTDGMLSRKEVIAYYCQKRGITPQNWGFYEVFGVFRLAVIAQQIYYHYCHKQTHNDAFKDLWFVIHALHVRALKLIGLQKMRHYSPGAQNYLKKVKGLVLK